MSERYNLNDKIHLAVGILPEGTVDIIECCKNDHGCLKDSFQVRQWKKFFPEGRVEIREFQVITSWRDIS